MIRFLVWRSLAFFLARYELIPAPDGTPYLSRWHFPQWVARLAGAPFLFLHHFHQSDPDRGWHDHPWIWCSSELLRGEYVQAIPYLWRGEWRPAYQAFHTGDTNRLTNERHAVSLTITPVWTLFRAGLKHGRSWSFMDRTGRVWSANGSGSMQ